MKIDKSKDEFRVPYASRLDMVLYATLGCLNITLVALFCKFVPWVDSVFCAVIATFVYLCEVMFIAFRREAASRVLPSKNIHSLLAEEGSVVLKSSKSPIIAFDYHGMILWYNDAMREAVGSYDNYIGDTIDELLKIDFDSLTDEEAEVVIGGRVYRAEGFVISKKSNGIYLTVLEDITDYTDIKKRYDDERVAIAYIAIDNVEDVLQYVQEKFADAVVMIEEKIKTWAASMNGIVKSYDNDKYIMLFDSSYLESCVNNRFEILDEVREARVGDGVSITVSIGISKKKGSLAERELDAKDAIDMALQRGGDQVVYKSESGVIYFGGKTKTIYKRANVRSRTFANQLTSLMARSDNVIIMGHRFGDFDSFGACIGIARLAALCGVKANIAVDLRDKNLKPCVELMRATEMYELTFVDNADGLDLLGPDTLVVLVDHSSLTRAQFADIAMKATTVAVVDHHRQNDELTDTVALAYIEPSASSACELVTEMLESAVSSQNLIKEEADLLLAGILLDTKQFTRNTGTRTFGAAQYLRGAGANPSDVYNLFKAAPEDLSKEARFHTSIVMYKGGIAFACCDGETDESYRVIASKAADKMLTLRGVNAAFALVHIGEQIHISGRSSGKVNVQLILEKLHGGGHFDVAGAQVVSNSVTDVLDALKDSIDTYLETNPISN